MYVTIQWMVTPKNLEWDSQPLSTGGLYGPLAHNGTSDWEGTGPPFSTPIGCSRRARLKSNRYSPTPSTSAEQHVDPSFTLSYARASNWFSRSPDTTRATSHSFWECHRSLAMDHNNIPSFALLRHGTVIVRVKMDVTSDCCGSQVPTKGYRRVVHRISSCEQCSRTRMNRYSDCDSGLVEKCRPYRGSAARRSKLFSFFNSK